MSEPADLPYIDVLGRIGVLADELLNHADSGVQATAGELLDWIDAFHRDGLGQLVEMVRAWRGEIFLEALAGDAVAGTLLRTYGLGTDRDVEAEAAAAVAAALEEIRPYAESHGGSIVVESVVDGVVRINMLGSCDGCPSSADTLTHGVEEALRRHWSDFRRLELAGEPELVEAAGPLLQIRGHEQS